MMSFMDPSGVREAAQWGGGWGNRKVLPALLETPAEHRQFNRTTEPASGPNTVPVVT
jgi:hypothetical protein